MDLLQSRHDSPVAAAQPRPLGGVPAQSADTSSIDECHYYRGVFGSNVAMVLRRLLRLCTRYSASVDADGDLRQRDHRVARGHRLGADRADRRRGDRGRITAGRAHRRAVGAGAARRHRRRKRRSGTAFRRRGGRTGDGGSDRRGRPHADVRAVAPRRRTDRAGCAGTTGRHRSGSRRAGGVLSGRLSGRGPPRTGTRTGRRRIARAGHHQRAGAGRRHRRPGRRGAGRLSRHRHVVLAAGRPLGPPRARVR